MGRNLTRWLIPLPTILFAFWPTVIQAQAQPGLATTYYTIDEIPPVQSTSEYPVCGSEVENNINRSYDGELFEDCTYDLFMVHMTGFITIPEHETIEFMIASDDGGEITIDGNTFGVWWDQGCTWTMSGNLELNAESVPLELWMYENGGGTCLMLAWKIDDGDWMIVPDEAFTQQSVQTTTTSSTMPSTTSSTPATSTTVEETTTTTSTTSSTSTTTLPSTTTTTQIETTTSTTSTTQSPTTTVAPAPTTTQAPYTPPQTTTSSSSTSLPEPSTTTTTVAPEPETTTSTTTVETSTTYPSSSLPKTPDPTVPALPVETTMPSPQPSPETSIQQTSTTQAQSSSTTTILDIAPKEPISDTKVAEVLTELKQASPAQIVEAVTQILSADLTSNQAVAIASTPEVLAAVTQDQAEQIFEELVVEEITVEQADELVAVLNEAPTKVKKAFQDTINVFAGVFDSFRMVGQTIPVGERRTLVAVSNTLVAIGASLRRREN